MGELATTPNHLKLISMCSKLAISVKEITNIAKLTKVNIIFIDARLGRRPRLAASYSRY